MKVRRVKRGIKAITFLAILVYVSMTSVCAEDAPEENTADKGITQGVVQVGKEISDSVLDAGKAAGSTALTVTKGVGKAGLVVGGETVGTLQSMIQMLKDPIIVTASRTVEQLTDVARSMIVVSQDDIEKMGNASLPQIIQQKSGIQVSDYLGKSKGAIVDIRGFGESSPSNVLVLVDGRRINQVDLSGADWTQIDPMIIERLEIIKGAGTVLYGDNASAGVVNIITKKGEQSDRKIPKCEVQTSWGSNQTKRVSTSISGALGKYADYYFNYGYNDTDNFRLNNEYWSNDYFGKINVYPTETFMTTFSGGYHYDKYEMPGALYSYERDAAGREGSSHDEDTGRTSDYFFTAEPAYTWLLDETEITFSCFNSFRHRNTKALNIYNAWGHAEYETIHHTKTYDMYPKVAVHSDWEHIDNTLVGGIDFRYVEDDVLSGDRSANTQDSIEMRKKTFATYLKDNIKVYDHLLFNIGGRAEWNDYTFNQRKQVANTQNKSLRAAAFETGVGFKVTEHDLLYFNYNKAFRAPNTEELYQNKYIDWFGNPQGGLNTDIKMQTSNNFETGYRFRAVSWLNVDIAAFLMDVKNEIYFDPATYKNSNYNSKTRHYGLELDCRGYFFENRIKPFVHYTLQEAFFKGGIYADHQIPMVAKNKLLVGITISPIKNLNWTTDMNYTSGRYKVSDQNNHAARLNSFVLVNSFIDYTFKNMKVWGGIRNIFNNERYNLYGVTNSAGSAETFYPGPGRSFEIGTTITY